ncbi:NTPase [Candidatus Micrarchaeota archaeon]|nr:NTPase [Candidatus Micrarchaeota archaeon]
MAHNVFLTGRPKSGKTTLMEKVIKSLKRKYNVGGFYTPEERKHGTRDAFHVVDIKTGKSGILAVAGGGGPRVGKYGINIKEFESTILPLIKNYENYDVIVIDEIGTMEMKSRKFQDFISELLESSVPVIASVQMKLASEYRSFGALYEVTDIKRELVYMDVMKDIEGNIMKKSKIKKKPAKKEKKKKPAKKEKKPKKGKAVKKEKKKTAVKKQIKQKKKSSAVKKKEKPEKKKKKAIHHRIMHRIKRILS